MDRVFCFSNQCAGVGKTAVCVNMAACLGAAGKKTLVADLDPRGCATAALGGSPAGGTIADALLEDEDVRGLLCPTPMENVALLSASRALGEAEIGLVYKRNGEHALRNALGQVLGDFDYVLLDCPPSLGILTINALTASDGAIVPVDCEKFSSEELQRLLKTVSLVRLHLNKGLKVTGAVLTMYDGRAAAAHEAETEARNFFKKRLFGTVIPRTPRAAPSAVPDPPAVLSLSDGRTAAARAYAALTEEFLIKTQGKGE